MSIKRENSGQQYDVVVIGGGPAGMMAAGRAAERSLRVLLLEKNKELGKKLSITGGGRCNILNAEKDTRVLLTNYGDAAKFLHSPFSQFGMKETFAFFESEGLPLVVEARKRVFPASQSAKDVTRTMKQFVSKGRVTIKTGVKVQGFDVEEGNIVGVKTNKGTFHGVSFVLGTGGMSHQDTGSTGEGMFWLRDLGYTVHEPNPDIVPLKVSESWVTDLSGTTLSFMKITFGKGKEKFSRVGKILFTHFGISGPLVLNCAHEVKKLLAHGPVDASIDLYPDTEVGTVRNRILDIFEKNKNKMLKNILKECVPHGMDDAVGSLLTEELREKKVHSVSKEERHMLVDIIKSMPLTITGTMGYDWAVVSDGGVDLKEINMKTMASKLHPNLYFTGDILNISRPSGGFSLQLCWTTGWVAGSNA